MWPAGARPVDLAEVLHLTGNVDYWVGDYDASVEHFQASRDIGASDPRSAEALMRGASGRAVALAGTGRYEEAIEASEAGIAAMKLLGHPYYTALNYSTLTLREIFAVEEAAERSAMVADSLGPSDFNMPWMNARADVLVAALLGARLRDDRSRLRDDVGGCRRESSVGAVARERAAGRDAGRGRSHAGTSGRRRNLGTACARAGVGVGAFEVRGGRAHNARRVAWRWRTTRRPSSIFAQRSRSRTISGRRCCAGGPSPRSARSSETLRLPARRARRICARLRQSSERWPPR